MRPFKSFICAALLTSCTFLRSGSTTPSPNPTSLFVTSEILQGMFSVQREFEVESAWCLMGSFDPSNGVLQLTTMTPAWVHEADSFHVVFKGCDGAIAWYHNHPSVASISVDTCVPSTQDSWSLAPGSPFMALLLTCPEPNTLVWVLRGSPRVFTWSGEVPPPA